MSKATDNASVRSRVCGVGVVVRGRLAVLWLALLGVLQACDECADTPPKTAIDAPPSRERHAAPTPQLTSSAAFELVASTEGAVLSWAAGPCSEGVHVQRFATDGEPVAEPVRLDGCGPLPSAAQIVQLSAVADGGKLGLAWIAQTESEAQVLGSFGADSGASFAPTLLLGAAATSASPGRSGLSMAGAESGQMRVSWRATDDRCSTGEERCARVFTTSHPPAQEVAARGSDVREVPVPCPDLLVGSLWRQGIWYEAFCALDGPQAEPVTEVYAIRPEIFYAEAFPVLAGCSPLGVAPAPRGVLVLGMCADGLRVHALGESHRDVIRNPVRDVRCESGRPTFMIRNGQGQSIVYKLDAPTDRLELWLSGRLATSESRVAFTGRTLLVATVQDMKLNVQAWKCQGERLVSDSPAML